MTDQRSSVPVILAPAIGASLWFAAAIVSGKREAWDATVYWTLAYPTAVLACAYLGYSYPERPWRWALVLFQAQFVAMCIRNGELGGLWPLGALLFAVIALPGVAVAKLAARQSRRAEGGGKQ